LVNLVGVWLDKVRGGFIFKSKQSVIKRKYREQWQSRLVGSVVNGLNEFGREFYILGFCFPGHFLSVHHKSY
jgi:hypothetical protein